jgi:hypothetical protein
MQHLKAVAVDQDHYNYMKNLAHTQPITLPLTILHGMTEEMLPVLEDVFRCNICCLSSVCNGQNYTLCTS